MGVYGLMECLNSFFGAFNLEDEQQQLLGAAKIIQNAFRKYRVSLARIYLLPT